MSKSLVTTNRLIHDKSPYLLQHAHNPIDWFSWGEEAFAKALAEDKPIFLSIGYSTCHWCHVMARESFEDEEVAKILNQHYISIKVDREERPDIDQIYMTACQAMTGEGGWPLTIVMTPKKKPFFAGTYFPKRTKWGRRGLMEILVKIVEEWNHRREDIVKVGRQVLEALDRQEVPGNKQVGEETLRRGYRGLVRTFDESLGGFGSAPKFPSPHILLFLLRYWAWTKEDEALKMVEKTLDAMACGGIFDHIGFGFHRYSTDAKWLVPHFEKMLYDNALLAYTYLEAYLALGNEEYGQVARWVLEYIRRDMTSKEGVFYSAEDADTEGVEGKFYVFTPDEVVTALGPDDGRWFCSVYDITPEGNFEGYSIPNLLKGIKVPREDTRRLARCREQLFKVREKRPKPHKDDKLLTSWNGLMIVALAKGARVLEDEDLAQRAIDATQFIFENLITNNGRLMARYRNGDVAFLAYLDDYAFMIWGLIELYEATFNFDNLNKALEMMKTMEELFWDEKRGGFFFTGVDSEELIIRPKEIFDGAMPSGNSVMVYNLLKLSRYLADETLEEKAHEILWAFSEEIDTYPLGHCFSLMALLTAVMPPKEIVISGEARAQDTLSMIRTVAQQYLPEAITLLNPVGREGDELRKTLPYLKEMVPLRNTRATAYVCENFACKAPVQDIPKLIEVLNQVPV